MEKFNQEKKKKKEGVESAYLNILIKGLGLGFFIYAEPPHTLHACPSGILFSIQQNVAGSSCMNFTNCLLQMMIRWSPILNHHTMCGVVKIGEAELESMTECIWRASSPDLLHRSHSEYCSSQRPPIVHTSHVCSDVYLVISNLVCPLIVRHL